MKRVKKMLGLLVVLFLLFGVLQNKAANAQNEELDEKVYCTATLEDDFAENRVLVVFDNESSLKFDELQPSDFSEVNCTNVYDLSKATDEAVKLKMDALGGGICGGDASRVASEQNITNLEMRSYKRIVCLELEEKGKESVLEAIETLEKRKDILYVGPDYKISVAMNEPNDQRYDEQWAINMIQLPQAWDMVDNPSMVYVGVLDTGINGAHPDLVNKVAVNASRDFTNGGIATVGSVTDPNGHGTHVAGIIGAQADNTIGISGTCWNTNLVSLRVLDANGNGYASSVAIAIDYANQARIPILNFSGRWYGSDLKYDYALNVAIESYYGLFVCAAGNEGRDADRSAVYPAIYRMPNLISVGASRSNDIMWDDSNYGNETVDLFAPGAGILSTYTGNGYTTMSGTSMATPHVAGVAAILLSMDLSLSANELKQAIEDGVDVIYDSNGNNVFGDVCVTGGRLNAYKAMHCAGIHEFVSYTATNGSVHRAYCSYCREYISEAHKFVVSGSSMRCTDCGYQLGLMK